MQVREALRSDKKYTVLTCDVEDHSLEEGVRNFKPIGVYQLSVYPEQKLFYPPFLEMLNYCYEQGFTHIHSATPGPLGLAALAIARILKLPFVGTYHTALPQYARYLTDDGSIEDLMWHYIVWYYDQMDLVYVPSGATAKELTDKGVNPLKIRLFPRGVDVDRFHPCKRNGIFDGQCKHPDGLRLLYVGRVSKEKNLEILVNVFKELEQHGHKTNLIVVGDGPYRSEMEMALQDSSCIFTGYLEGEKLAAAYASCDLFIFPSTTDTFGNVVLEAQAAGLPVVVTNCGGPQENMLPGITGLVVDGNDERGLLEALRRFIHDPHAVKVMGRAAREYMENRSFKNAFSEAWQLYAEATTTGLADFEIPRDWFGRKHGSCGGNGNVGWMG
jgi:glycosyltransferase involved in cell wall biosynthesis